MTEFETIIVDVDETGIATLILNRPDKRNAFNSQMILELTTALAELENTDGLRGIFVTGAGKCFSAGADLDWMKAAQSWSREENEADAAALAEMFRKLAEFPGLTIALVQGAAMGGGAGLVAACDVAVAVAGTKFSFSEIKLGLTAATISPFVMNAIGPRWAKALFTTAEVFDANFAEKIGLVQYSVENQDGMEEMADYLATLTLAGAPGAIADSKRLVLDLAGQSYSRQLSHETARRIAARRVSTEGQEGIGAFLEKRAPDWKWEEV